MWNWVYHNLDSINNKGVSQKRRPLKEPYIAELMETYGRGRGITVFSFRVLPLWATCLMYLYHLIGHSCRLEKYLYQYFKS
jgi:hypothetical protein